MTAKKTTGKQGRPKGTTSKRKTSTTSTKAKKAGKSTEKEQINIPACVGRESDTFRTLRKKAAMLDALKFSMGIVAPACDMAGISRNTHYDWLKSDPGYAQEVHNINEGTFDFVETQMLKRIQAGSDTMLIWYSKTKMKSRGFVERTEVEVTEKPAFIVKPEHKGVNKVMDVIHKKTGTNDK